MCSFLFMYLVRKIVFFGLLMEGTTALKRRFVSVLPSCTVIAGNVTKVEPTMSSTPRNWYEALKHQVDTKAGDCYSRKQEKPREIGDESFHGHRVERGKCCCAFWKVDSTDLPAIADAEPACQESYSTLSANLSEHFIRNVSSVKKLAKESNMTKSTSECRFAIAISGKVTDEVFTRLPDLLRNLSEGYVTDGVCAVIFVSAPSYLVGRVGSMLNRNNWINDFEVEPAEDEFGHLSPALDNAISTCTGSMFQVYLNELRDRHNGYFEEGPYSSTMSMYRKIWMAHFLAQKLKPSGLIARARIDIPILSQRFDWEAALKQAQEHQGILIGEPPGMTKEILEMKSAGVGFMERCAMDDKFAVGLPDAMDGYASVYPDFKDFARVLLIFRRDQEGHVNERILTQHLHYRGVSFKTTLLNQGGTS